MNNYHDTSWPTSQSRDREDKRQGQATPIKCGEPVMSTNKSISHADCGLPVGCDRSRQPLHYSCISNVQHLTPPPALSSSETSTPTGSKPRPRKALIR